MDGADSSGEVRELGEVGHPVATALVATPLTVALPAIVDEHRAAPELCCEGGFGAHQLGGHVLGERVPRGVDPAASHRRRDEWLRAAMLRRPGAKSSKTCHQVSPRAVENDGEVGGQRVRWLNLHQEGLALLRHAVADL